MDTAQIERLVAALIAQLEAGTTPWRREWDGATGGHHANLLSGRRYRGVNPILLTLGMHQRGASLPYWCGFVEARTRGLVPRRGSKAVVVLRPQVHRQHSGSCADGPDQDCEREAWVSFRPLPLFNAADLVGPALDDLLATRVAAEASSLRPEPQRLASAEHVLGAWEVPVCLGAAMACYQPQLDQIQLPQRAAFHSPSAFYATWAHEAVHSTGHRSRLDRDLSGSLVGGEAAAQAYAREELVAELGAVLLGDRLEIGSDTANHAAYLQHWITLLRESPRVLLQVLSDARRAADLVAPEQAPASSA
jgi:antirestriction protein ArdC